MRKRVLIVLSGLAITLFSGCRVDELFNLLEGTPVVFSANTRYANGFATRTVYSGYDEDGELVGSTSKWERIDWEDGDLIRIWCDQEIGMGNLLPNASDHYADYRVVSHSSSGKSSVATLENAGTNGLTWNNSKSHTFYALYPSPATENVDASKVKLEGNKLSGTIPAAQTKKLKEGSTTFYLPDMNYAYMWAANSTLPSSNVSLEFKPLMTAFEFTVDSDGSDAMQLYSFTLSSSSTDLTGEFTVTVNSAQDGFSLETKNTGRSITVDFGGSTNPTLVTKGSPITFTVFALPQDITGLTIAFETANGTKKLALKKDDEFVTFPVCKKIRITNLSVSDGDWEYHIDNLTSLTLSYLGTTDVGEQQLSETTTFTSKRSNGTVEKAVPFKLQYSLSSSGPWTDGLPAWVSVTAPSYNSSKARFDGNASGETLSLTMAKSDNTAMSEYHTSDTHGKKLYDAAAKSNFDLSTVNVATGATVTSTTANCYVVQAPGTYRIPIVYGNGRVNNATNQDAFRAKAGVDATDYRADAGATGYLGRFRDHLGAVINNPLITTQHSGKTFTAKLLWTDSENLVQNVNISGNYITFSVPKDFIHQGNALIAVLANNVIAWSWHIWVTDADLTATKEGSNKYYFAPVPIGWCDPATVMKHNARSFYVRAVQEESGKISNAVKITQNAYSLTYGGNSPYYQWGRKDPLLPSNGIGNTDKTYYSSSSTDSPKTVVGKRSLAYSIQHPNEFISDGDADIHDWCSTTYYNLWNSVLNGYGDAQSAASVTKTIYDPSPVGFQLMPRAAYTGFSTETFVWYATTKGCTYTSGLFVPAAGDRLRGGNLGYVGTNGWVWSATPYSSQNSYCLPVSSGALSLTLSHNRAFGFPVMPVIDPGLVSGANSATVNGNKYDFSNRGWQ